MTAGVLHDIIDIVRSAFKPDLHPVAGEVERAADEVVRESKKLGKRADAFGTMVRGMRGDAARSRSGRGAKRR